MPKTSYGLESWPLQPADEGLPAQYEATRTIAGRKAIRLLISGLTAFTDVLAITFSIAVASWMRFGEPWSDNSKLIAIFLLTQFLLLAVASKTYSVHLLTRTGDSIIKALFCFVLASMSSLGTSVATKMTVEFSRLEFGYFFALACVSLVCTRWIIGKLAGRISHHIRPLTLLGVSGVVSTQEPADAIINFDALALRLDDPNSIDRLASSTSAFERIVVSCPDVKKRELWTRLLRMCGVNAEVVVPEFQTDALGIGSWKNYSTLIISRGALRPHEAIIKRTFDILGSIAFLALLSPILLIAALAIKLDSPGPVIFRQRRVGQNNKHFWVFKFRTMRHEMTDANGSRSASRDDDRITTVGRILRKWSIDELPQLLNVLIGNLSLVGPRPHALSSRAGGKLFWEVDGNYWSRHVVKPGMTGLAQVRGYRGATENEHDLTGRLESDMHYIRNWSLTTDLAILFRTLFVLAHNKAF